MMIFVQPALALRPFALVAMLILAAQVAAEPMTITHRAGDPNGRGYTDGQGTAARFTQPAGIDADAEGNLYVTDVLLQTVRRITPGGQVTTVAGQAGVAGSTTGAGSTALLTFPYEVEVDSSGNLYVRDGGSPARILRISSHGVVSVMASLAATVTAMTLDPIGQIFAADTTGRIWKITPAGDVTVFAGPGATGTSSILALAVDWAGVLHAGDSAGMLWQFSASGVASKRFAVTNNGLSAIEFDAAGNAYVLSSGNSPVYKATPAGHITVLAGSGQQGSDDGPGPTATFLLPIDLALAPNGEIFVTDRSSIRRVSTSLEVSTFAGASKQCRRVDGDLASARFSGPRDAVSDANGNLFVAEWNVIRKIAGGTVTTFARNFGFLGAIAIDGSGNLYASDHGLHVIRKITPAGAVSIFAGTSGSEGSVDGTGAAARFNTPADLVVDADGNLFVTDAGNATIRKITPAGVVTTYAGLAGAIGDDDGVGSTARFRSPSGLAIDGDGTLYVTDNTAHTIRRVTSGAIVSTLAGSPRTPGSTDGIGSQARFRNPSDIEILGGVLYVIDEQNEVLRAVTTAGAVTTVAGMYDAAGSAPGTGSTAQSTNGGALAIENGNLLLVDFRECNIRSVKPPGIADTATVSNASPAVGATVQLGTDVETATSWQWSIARRPAGSSAELTSTNTRSPSFTPDVADRYTFLLRAEGSAGVRYSAVSIVASSTCNPIAYAIARVSGSNAAVCVIGTKTSLHASISGGSGITVQWGWRTTPNGPTTPIAGATSTSYQPQLADFPGAGTYYLVATVTPSCGPAVVTNPMKVDLVSTPPAQIIAGSAVFANYLDNFASVAAGGNATYAWTASNAFISGSTNGPSIRYTAGSSGEVVLGARVVANGCASDDEVRVPIIAHTPGASMFYLVTPCRILDTRGGDPLASGATRVVYPIGGACGIPHDAQALAVNVTAIAPATSGYLSLFPSNVAWPGTSTMNYRAGKTRANNAIVQIAPDRAISVLNNGAPLHFLIDVTGYFR